MSGTALVTGGTRGIGLGIAKSLVGDGYRVAVNGVRPEPEVEEVVGELQELGDVVYVRGDVSDPDDRARIVADTIAATGSIDVLVNNAAVTGRKDMLTLTSEDFDVVMDVNLVGPFHLTQAVATHMVERHQAEPSRRGCIVNVSSISADMASTLRAPYCISKAGVSMATKLWATRLAEYAIDVYEVKPGIIATDMTVDVTEKYDRLIEEGLMLEPRWGSPDDVGKAVAALARGDLPYATGQVLTIDGGLTVPRL